MTPREMDPIQESITISRPVTAVFDALTDSDAVAGWLGEDAYIELCDDGRYEVLGQTGWKKGRIKVLDGPRRLVFSWPVELHEDYEEPTQVEFRLDAQGTRTQVKVSHTGFSSGGEWDVAYRKAKVAWSPLLTALARFVEHNTRERRVCPLP